MAFQVARMKKPALLRELLLALGGEYNRDYQELLLERAEELHFTADEWIAFHKTIKPFRDQRWIDFQNDLHLTRIFRLIGEEGPWTDWCVEHALKYSGDQPTSYSPPAFYPYQDRGPVYEFLLDAILAGIEKPEDFTYIYSTLRPVSQLVPLFTERLITLYAQVLSASQN